MKLSSGEADALQIPQADGSIIHITMIKPQSRTQQLLEKIRKKPLSSLKRPEADLFDYLD